MLKANNIDSSKDAAERSKYEVSITYYRQQLSRNLQQHRENNSRLMKDNVYLITRINEMRKEEQETTKQIKILQCGMPDGASDEQYQNEQRKDLELMDLTIARYQQELEQTQIENEQLRLRRPPQNLAPIQQQQMDDMDMNGDQDQGVYQDEMSLAGHQQSIHEQEITYQQNMEIIQQQNQQQEMEEGNNQNDASEAPVEVERQEAPENQPTEVQVEDSPEPQTQEPVD